MTSFDTSNLLGDLKEELDAEENQIEQEEPQPNRVYTERFLILFLFSLCTCINACGWICFGPIFNLVEFVSFCLLEKACYNCDLPLGVWRRLIGSQLPVDELHATLLADELSSRTRSR